MATAIFIPFGGADPKGVLGSDLDTSSKMDGDFDQIRGEHDETVAAICVGLES